MVNIHSNLTELIGNTPLLALSRLTEAHQSKARIVAKIESRNPGGSVKDRVALAMITSAEQQGKLVPGSVIVEPTSGNTGVGLAWIGRLKGYRVIIVMPDTMSIERRRLISASGAQVVLTEGSKGMAGAIAKAEEIKASTPGAVIMGQFENPANPLAHETFTGEEIWRDTDGQVDIFVAGVGTGGTLTGVARTLKRHNPAVKAVAVEPLSSPVLSGGKAGAHKIQGIGAGFVPPVFDARCADEIMTVSNDDAMQAMLELSQREGLLAGISSGAAVCASLTLASRPENEGKLIVTLLPDTGERYLSLWPGVQTGAAGNN